MKVRDKKTYKLTWPVITIALASGAARRKTRRFEKCMMMEYKLSDQARVSMR